MMIGGDDMGCIYMVRNLVTGMAYIGQTKDPHKRFNTHKNLAFGKRKNNYPLYVDMRNYGIDNFEFIILEDNVPQEEMGNREKYYIEKYDTYNNGYNRTIGGHGVTGYTHTEEARKKMSVAVSAAMWKINTPERTKKIIAAQKGRKFSELHKQHIRESIGDRSGEHNSFYGKQHTDATKQKISDKNTKYSVCQCDPYSGEIIRTFETVKDAAECCISSGITSAKIQSVIYRIYYTCSGNQKKCYGYVWKYVEKCID